MGELGLPFPENDSPPHSPNRRMKKSDCFFWESSPILGYVVTFLGFAIKEHMMIMICPAMPSR